MMSEKQDLESILSEEAELFEAVRDTPPKASTRIRPASGPSQIYSLRIPVDRIEELRVVAKGRGTTPSALVRQWILEKLDEEILLDDADAEALRPFRELHKEIRRAIARAAVKIVEPRRQRGKTSGKSDREKTGKTKTR